MSPSVVLLVMPPPPSLSDASRHRREATAGALKASSLPFPPELRELQRRPLPSCLLLAGKRRRPEEEPKDMIACAKGFQIEKDMIVKENAFFVPIYRRKMLSLCQFTEGKIELPYVAYLFWGSSVLLQVSETG
nr:hypothetical protein Itr_chr06CG14740 [Ipomoea trifida]